MAMGDEFPHGRVRNRTTTCPHCGEDQGTRTAFTEHVESGCQPTPWWKRVYWLFDNFVFPIVVALIGWVEMLLGNSSVGLALVMVAALWVKPDGATDD